VRQKVRSLQIAMGSLPSWEKIVGIVVTFADGAKSSFKLYMSLGVKKSVVSWGNLYLRVTWHLTRLTYIVCRRLSYKIPRLYKKLTHAYIGASPSQ
jgi:hypothetical protein